MRNGYSIRGYYKRFSHTLIKYSSLLANNTITLIPLQPYDITYTISTADHVETYWTIFKNYISNLNWQQQKTLSQYPRILYPFLNWFIYCIVPAHKLRFPGGLRMKCDMVSECIQQLRLQGFYLLRFRQAVALYKMVKFSIMIFGVTLKN